MKQFAVYDKTVDNVDRRFCRRSATFQFPFEETQIRNGITEIKRKHCYLLNLRLVMVDSRECSRSRIQNDVELSRGFLKERI